MAFRTASVVGKAGIAPLSVTVNAPQALANLRASLNLSSFYNMNECFKGNKQDGTRGRKTLLKNILFLGVTKLTRPIKHSSYIQSYDGLVFVSARTSTCI